MTVNAAPARPAPARPKPKLPEGLRWSDVWRSRGGELTRHDREIPVDKDWYPAGELWLCPTKGGCQTEEWTFTQQQERPCCRHHPVQLIPVAADANDRDPVAGARARLAAKLSEVVARRKQAAIDAATARAVAARAAVSQTAQRTAADMRGHVPSLTGSAAVAAADLTLAAYDPLLAELVGLVVMSFGAVLAYVTVYATQRLRARRASVDLVGRAARRVRGRAYQAAAAVLAAGVYAVLAGLLGVDPATLTGDAALLLAPLLAWTVNRRHWETLWETRRRLRALARQRAEEAARRAEEEAAQLAQQPQPAPAVVEETPESVGRWLAAEWRRISESGTVPPLFMMSRTWIVPEETRAVTASIDEETVRIGWEFAIESEPGALVPRLGSGPPLLQVREWLAAMLGRDPVTVSLVDKPEGRVNRGLLILTDRAPLGGAVRWLGRTGVRVMPDGAIYAHVGRSMSGEDVFEPAYLPGQPFGGLTVGHTGGGKSAGTILMILNDLVAGIFPLLYDPKQLVDYADFIGVFPIGVTREHRDVIRQSLTVEMRRRQQHLTTRPRRDRFGRPRGGETLWNIKRDGPPLHSIWEEFHLEAKDLAFCDALTEIVRLQRVTAMGVDVISQGGGLQDWQNSVLRGLLGETRRRLYRMPDQQARLAGYNGNYSLSGLPRLPGVCLTQAVDVPEMTMRMAFVTRADEDGSVYDHLYDPEMRPLLAPPPLPAETVAVFRREGLMDLWELGKGPNGLSNLLGEKPSAVPASAVGATTTSGPTGPLPAADVVLAITMQNPGCPRATFDNHPVWQTPAAGGKTPVPSTISRAAAKLASEGLLTRHDNAYQVTDKGRERATAAAAALFGSTPEPATAAGEDRLASYVLSALANPDGPMTVDDVHKVLLERGWIDASVSRHAVVAKLEELRDMGWVARVGDRYEVAAATLAHLADQIEAKTRPAGGGHSIGSQVMSVLTGTVNGDAISVEDVCAAIVANGWAAAPDEVRAAVVTKLLELREHGLVSQECDRFALSQAAIEQLTESACEDRDDDPVA